MRRLCGSLVLVTTACLVLGCTEVSESDGAPTYTLYRNSPFDSSMRVHWGTFDANERDRAYNLNNCNMAARLLNANFAATARAEGKEPHPNTGFWCERGDYSEEGPVPSTFEAAYPTDV